jgi:hypothetical protein
MTINLNKQEARTRLDHEMATHAPSLINLSKTADKVLEKRQLNQHDARVALVLDISASMHALYQQGTVQRVTEKALALASRFDNDGQMDMFLFGKAVHDCGSLGIKNIQQAVNALIRKHPLESSTRYGLAMHALRQHYFAGIDLPDLAPTPSFLGRLMGQKAAVFKAPLPPQTPIFVLFITDGETTDQALAIDELTRLSQVPIFFKFIGVGSESFHFLQRLDDLKHRAIDNADFVKFNDLDAVDDEQLYERLTQEYDHYLIRARQLQLIPAG